MSTPVKWVDENGIEHPFDTLFPHDVLSDSLLTISHAHHEIHDGHAYTAEHNTADGAGAKATISFTTPHTPNLIHLLVTMRSNVESFYTFGEGVTVTGASGSDYAPRNRNRNSDNTSSVISDGSTGGKGFLTLGGDITNFGTVLETLHIGQGRQGGESRDIREWVLKGDTTYGLEVESEAASSEITIEIHYYEL